MPTNTLHLNPRAGAVFVAAVLLAMVSCFSGKQGTGSASASTAGGETRTNAQVQEPDASGSGSTGQSTCPLRLPASLPSREIVVPILMYHRINVPAPSAPAATRRLTVSPVVFARQMAWLKRHGYRTITQRELFGALMCGRRLGPRPIMITFDDGYRDAFFKASPTLLRLGMHATAYVISGRISNGDPSFLTWPLLHALESRGIEIGSHTVSHRNLTSLSDSAAFAELYNARRALERHLGHRVPWLAYPFGAYNTRIEGLARRAGYVLAVTTQWGTRQSARRPLALRRLRILDSTGVSGLAAMLG
jgi:peptidoglycan/xylan/chitin deacetylase (PgdA/CDA1 family)